MIEKRAKAGHGPSLLSSPKEIVGSHGHKSHGKSIRWPALYEHLLKKGYSKQKTAMISNGQWRKKHGLPPASARGVRMRRSLNIAIRSEIINADAMSCVTTSEVTCSSR